MRRLTLLLGLLLGFALLATACGSDDDTTEAGSELPGETDDGAADDPAPDDEAPDDDLDLDGDTDDTLPADAPLGAGPYPIADVSFSVDLGDGTTQDYRLACLGDTATFTGDAGGLDAAAACLALTDDEVRDRFLTDQHLDRICTEIFGGPELAGVTGTLDDQPIDTTVDRANGCGIDDWDRLLAALLPAALG